MHTYYYAKTKRQYKYLIKRLNKLLQNGEWENLSEKKQNTFKTRLKILFQKLEGAFSSPSLIKAMGTAALVLGLSVSTMAQSFKAPVNNPFSLTNKGALGIPSFADIDGDGDLDLFDLDIGYTNITVTFKENTGTASAAVFGPSQSNPFGITSDSVTFKSVFTDLDNDGDLDMMRSSYYGNHFYYENTGTKIAPVFASPVLNPFGLTQQNELIVGQFVDLDSDGDADYMVGEYYGDFYYYKNTGTKSTPQFAAPVKNPFGLTNTGGDFSNLPEFSDIDGDGDLDMMFVEYYGDFWYYKNTGTKTNPQFGTPTSNPFSLANVGSYPSFMAFADLDGDSDDDIFVVEYYGNYRYYENNSGIGLDENALNNQLYVFPNPANGVVNISLGEDLGAADIEITSTSGQLVQTATLENTNNASIDVSTLETGVYILKLTADNRVGVKKLIIE